MNYDQIRRLGEVCFLLVATMMRADAQVPIQTDFVIGHLLTDPAGDHRYVDGVVLTFGERSHVNMSVRFDHYDRYKINRVALYSKAKGADLKKDCREKPCWSEMRLFSNYESAEVTGEFEVERGATWFMTAFRPTIYATRAGEPVDLQVVRWIARRILRSSLVRHGANSTC